MTGWKMLFNSDRSKPAQEVLFSRERQVQIHTVLIMSDIQVERVPYQKHFGIKNNKLDNKLDFKQYIENTISKINKGFSMIRKLRHILTLKSLVTIYKVLLRLLIDYGDIIISSMTNFKMNLLVKI